ncbi:LuxR family transcriptional regulator [Antarcticimicrobium luteum]|uniref:LuxR family transcriptional regulator n=1 Tax=Antarcticimicrobium luteum TaxID=2547397 RepID=A0A4R5V060_9RHOB|nr:LuxR family transcriptional regulator [Antarcticimicrobium luteum]TDK45118.1 LuxR family transcriptional regulator [Antarcticimicrobium luteum]
MTMRNYLKFITRATSLELLWAAHTEEMARYGFDRLIYGYTRYRTETSLGDPEDFVILTNHSEEYVDGFLHEGLYFHAPMLHWALKHEGAGSWRMINNMMANRTMTPEEQTVYEFNQRMGVAAGYTISFNSVSVRAKGAISLCARPGLSQADVDEIWNIHGDDILLMNNVAHLKILTLPHVAPNRSLTKRQREALEWVGDGKTTQDIAVLMGLTPATVEKHLRLAREALSVETTAQAVMKAALHNQMFVIEA